MKYYLLLSVTWLVRKFHPNLPNLNITMEGSIKKPKIVVLGSCAIDFSTYSPRLPLPGETLHGTKFETGFGGKGANQCVASVKLGGNASMICRIGDDHWGTQYRDYFKGIGVDITYVHVTKGVSTGIAQIAVAENGENQIIFVAGANNFLSVSDVHNAEQLIKDTDVLIAQLETPFETSLEAFKIAKGIKLLNAAPARKDIQEILPYCSILCVNESEASLLVNFSVNMSNVTKALQSLIETGCKIVIITLGENGAVYMTKEDMQPIHVLCDKLVPMDTSGAGDAFVGALATFLVNEKKYQLHQIIGAACEVATISVTKKGTQSSYPSGYIAFGKEYKYVML